MSGGLAIVAVMSRHAHIPDELATGPFLTADALASGVSRAMLSGNAWRRLAHGIHVPADLAITTDVLVAAVKLVLPRGAVISGTSAALLHGCDIRLDSNEPIEITVPRGVTVGARGLLRVRQALVVEEDVVEVGGVAVTSPVRTAFDLARRPSITEVVVAVDALCRAQLVTLDELAAYAADHPGWRGVRQIPRAIDLADARAENPMETRLRMCIVLGGLPRPEVQLEVVEDGHVIARLDLAYEEALLDLEYDGRGHRVVPSVIARDVRRQRDLAMRGWTTTVFDAGDVFHRQRYICACVAKLLRWAA